MERFLIDRRGKEIGNSGKAQADRQRLKQKFQVKAKVNPPMNKVKTKLFFSSSGSE